MTKVLPSPPPLTVGRTPRKPRSRSRVDLSGYVFLAPWMIGFIFLTVGPMLASLYLSFTDYKLLAAPRWIGLHNYEKLLTDSRYHSAVMVTLKYVFIGVPAKLCFALLIAIVLKRSLRLTAVYRAVYYVPSLLGGSVAIAILWRQLFGQPGVVQQLLALAHIDTQGWLTSPSTALYTLVILEVWQFGSPMIIFLAALKQIPQDLYDAASVDGAGRLRQFRSVTLPLLTPIIFFNLILQMIGSFQAFTPSFVVSGGSGGPVDSTLFYTLYLYIVGFGQLQMGYASAMAWVLLLGIALITGILFATARYWVYYGDE